MRTELLYTGFLILALTIPAGAQPFAYERGSAGSIPPGDGCDEGEVPDDGTVEAGFGWFPSITYGGFVERFDAEAFSSGLERVCICLMQAVNFPPDLEQNFQIVVYDDDGPQNAPGTLLASISATATSVPLSLPGGFYDYDVADQVPSLPSDGNVFIGIEWQPNVEQDFFVCVDYDTPPNGGYTMSDTFPEWTPIEDSSTAFAEYGAMVIRAVGAREAIVEIPTLGGIGLTLLATLFVVASLRTLIRRRSL
jgi:hypothetical protein